MRKLILLLALMIPLQTHAGTKEDPDPICCDYYSEIPRQMKIIPIIGTDF